MKASDVSETGSQGQCSANGTSVNKLSPNILNQSILFFRWEPPSGSVTKGWTLRNIAGVGVGVFSIKNWPNLKEIGKTFSSGNFER